MKPEIKDTDIIIRRAELEHYYTTDNPAGTGAPAAAEIQKSVIGILSGMFMGGRELAARVIDELIEFNVTENEVFTVLDEMLESGTVILDAEEDEWSLP